MRFELYFYLISEQTFDNRMVGMKDTASNRFLCIMFDTSTKIASIKL